MSRYDDAMQAAADRTGPQGAGYWASLMRGVETDTLTFDEACAAWLRERGTEPPPVEEDHED